MKFCASVAEMTPLVPGPPQAEKKAAEARHLLVAAIDKTLCRLTFRVPTWGLSAFFRVTDPAQCRILSAYMRECAPGQC
jgi:hypothetical protein